VKLKSKRMLKRIFDLKGSMIGRETKPDRKFANDYESLFNASTTLKDINYLKFRRVDSQMFNNFDQSQSNHLICNMNRDVEFL